MSLVPLCVPGGQGIEIGSNGKRSQKSVVKTRVLLKFIACIRVVIVSALCPDASPKLANPASA